MQNIQDIQNHSIFMKVLIRTFGKKLHRTSYKKDYIDYFWSPPWTMWTYTTTERV